MCIRLHLLLRLNILCDTQHWFGFVDSFTIVDHAHGWEFSSGASNEGGAVFALLEFYEIPFWAIFVGKCLLVFS